ATGRRSEGSGDHRKAYGGNAGLPAGGRRVRAAATGMPESRSPDRKRAVPRMSGRGRERHP
ncbi:MAG: hypothetical protein LBR80_10275, partial [Deltaproteobacteria bacterium]|nr:hypothetical protein [Deltaproteobacteria bacterium]